MAEAAQVLSLPGPKRVARPRRRPAPNASLMQREMDALEALGRYHLLTGRQFERVSGYRDASAKAALRDLYRKGMLDRGMIPRPRTAAQQAFGMPPGPYETLCKLTKIGMERGKREGLIPDDARHIRTQWDGALIGSHTDARHRMLLVDFMIEVTECLARHPRLSIARMVPDFLTEKKLKATSDQIDQKTRIIPDLVIELEDVEKGTSTMLFVEVQNSRLQPRSKNPVRTTIATKLKPFGKYLANPARKFRADQSIILYLANEPADYATKTVPLIPWDEVGPVAKLVRFSTFDAIAGDALGPVWLNQRAEIVSILESRNTRHENIISGTDA